MIVCLFDILPLVEARAVRAELDRLAFADGAASAGKFATAVKNNRELPAGPETQKLQERVMRAIFASHPFEMAARPKTMKPVIFSRYEPGMAYGTHVDNPILSGRPPIRPDLSFTVFLSEPEDYDGGELVIEASGGPQEIKLPPGAMVLYPSGSLHHVAPVERGLRVAAISWVQSFIRDPAKRELLHDLEQARHGLFDREGKTREFDLVSKTFNNLVRMWAEL